MLVIAGKEYGSGSSRDWAAKGAFLLGVKAILTESYERIHRSNLVAMGVLPLQFREGDNAASLGLTGLEVYDIEGIGGRRSGPSRKCRYGRGTWRAGAEKRFQAIVRINSQVEVTYYRNGGILQTVLRGHAQRLSLAPRFYPTTHVSPWLNKASRSPRAMALLRACASCSSRRPSYVGRCTSRSTPTGTGKSGIVQAAQQVRQGPFRSYARRAAASPSSLTPSSPIVTTSGSRPRRRMPRWRFLAKAHRFAVLQVEGPVVTHAAFGHVGKGAGRYKCCNSDTPPRMPCPGAPRRAPTLRSSAWCPCRPYGRRTSPQRQ